jgi:peptidoglycan/LPS O-acetylase OafA/YrhL
LPISPADRPWCKTWKGIFPPAGEEGADSGGASSDRSGHIIELQSLRGIAATAVLFGHVVGYYSVPNWLVDLGRFSNGRAAVVIFFVLSGYVLTESLRSSTFDFSSVARFYVQRWFRIYPAIWPASLLGLGYLVALHWNIPVDNIGSGFDQNFRTDRYDLLHILGSFAGVQAFLLPQLWSIFIEIVASIAMPGIAFVALHRPRWMPQLLIIAVTISFAVEWSPYEICLYFMDFIVGSALAMRLLPPIALPWLVPVCLVILSATLFVPLSYVSPTAHIIETFFSALTISVLISTPVSWMRSRFMKFVGDISYSIYLLHFLVLCLIAKAFALVHLRLNTIEMTFLLAGATYAVTIPLAWMSYVYVEQPGVRLGKAVVTRYIATMSFK